MVRHCSWGLCKEDSRYQEQKPTADQVKFIDFPNPKTNPERAKEWIRLCGRMDLDIDHLRGASVCSKHFPLGSTLSVRLNPGLTPLPSNPQHEHQFQVWSPIQL